MFLAKFTQTTSDKFLPNAKTGEMPFYGDLLAGTARTLIIDAEWFHTQGLKPQTLYLCDTVTTEYEGKTRNQVKIMTEYGNDIEAIIKARKLLGAPKLITATQTVESKSTVEAEAVPFA
jgi:hypothetical protein